MRNWVRISYFIFVASVALLFASCASLQSSAEMANPSLNVMSFNIRYDDPADQAHVWPNRKELVAGTISFFQADIAGLQEVLVSQLKDLERLLPEYSWAGSGRDDGREAGEFNPIFYVGSRLRLLESATFWLSETPEKSGPPAWDAACPRIVTWARFRDKRTGSVLCVFNTHFDHLGERAREESARLLRFITDEIARDGPLIVTGDFNCTDEEPPIGILTAGNGRGASLADARRLSKLPPYGSTSTFNGFSAEVRPDRRIDHIFVRGPVSILRWGIVSERWDGRFASDHNPVLAEIRLARR